MTDKATSVCCGHPLTTPFCPFCGAASANPGHSLLTHLIKQRDIHARSLKRYGANRNQVDPDSKWSRHKRDLVARWSSWIEFVQSALQQQTTGKAR